VTLLTEISTTETLELDSVVTLKSNVAILVGMAIYGWGAYARD